MSRLVPDFILEKFAQGQPAGQFPAASLFVDVAGFTALTEALMEHGRAGSEALAALMSDLFEPLVQCIYEQGGFIASFFGDAFTALFPAEAAPRALA